MASYAVRAASRHALRRLRPAQPGAHIHTRTALACQLGLQARSLHDKAGSALKKTLGVPIPLHEHAVSVGMPLWSHVVGYEEGDPEVTDKLALGYPRFVYHPFVKQLVEVWKAQAVEEGLIGAHEIVGALPFPTREAALRCVQFLRDAHTHEPGFPVSLHPLGCLDVHMVAFPSKAAAEAKAFWQHSGEILSSRKAQAVLKHLGHRVPAFLATAFPHFASNVQREAAPPQVDCYRKALRRRLGALTGQAEEDVALTVSGMAAIFKAFHAAKAAFPGRRVVVFGFTYLDTLKICLRKEWSHGVHFLGRGDAADLQALRQILQQEKIMALFTEFPSNPLLQCPDLATLCELGREHGFPVVVDDTIANFHNVDPFAVGADMAVTSLTKLFSGTGDVMAGSLVLNRKSHFYAQLSGALAPLRSNCELYEDDARTTLANGEDFEARSTAINETTSRLVEWLMEQPGVKTVYYPKFTQRHIYDQVRRPESGYGGLFSVILEPHLSPQAFYDALDVFKGPSLGTNFTLACPYTILAHYTELDFAQKYGVCPNLVRVSVGLERYEDLEHAFSVALEAARTAKTVASHGAAA